MRATAHHHARFACTALGLAGALGCGASQPPAPPSVGPGASYRPPSLSAAAADGRAVRGLACRPGRRPRDGAHLELFANRHVVIVASGVGIAPPRRRSGAYVRSGRCEYPAITVEPTGIVQVERGVRVTLGDFFAIWGQHLSRTRLAGFAAPAGRRVLAFVGGRAWRGDPRAIPLSRHAQIVLEVAGYVAPHRRYRFPPGL
jgi:hypothetical protein